MSFAQGRPQHDSLVATATAQLKGPRQRKSSFSLMSSFWLRGRISQGKDDFVGSRCHAKRGVKQLIPNFTSSSTLFVSKAGSVVRRSNSQCERDKRIRRREVVYLRSFCASRPDVDSRECLPQDRERARTHSLAAPDCPQGVMAQPSLAHHLAQEVFGQCWLACPTSSLVRWLPDVLTRLVYIVELGLELAL
jgi:hypothetical protein